MMADEVLPLTVAARMAGLTPESLRAAVKRGELEAAVIAEDRRGRTRLGVSRADLREFLRKGRGGLRRRAWREPTLAEALCVLRGVTRRRLAAETGLLAGDVGAVLAGRVLPPEPAREAMEDLFGYPYEDLVSREWEAVPRRREAG